MMGEQQFCLRWNNHGSTLVAVFDNLLASESLVDVTLFAEGRLLRAHKVVLSACSPYFQTLFAQTNDRHPIVILKDVKYSELKALLDYMYRGEVNVAQDQLGPLIKTAESLKIKGLADGNRSESNERLAPPSRTLEESRPLHNLDTKSLRSTLEGFSLAPSTLSTMPPIMSVPSVLSSIASVPSVLSTALAMPSPLSLASSLNALDHNHRDESPHAKRRKKARKRSGEEENSGDSDGRSSGSPGDLPHLPRIPATIIPVNLQPRDLSSSSSGAAPPQAHSNNQQSSFSTHFHQLQQHPLSLQRDFKDDPRTSSPIPESGSHENSDPSPQAQKLSSDQENESPTKSAHCKTEDNSSDANHFSEDEYDEEGNSSSGTRGDRSNEQVSDSAAGPSKGHSDDSVPTTNYLSWGYPPDPSGNTEESFTSSVGDVANQDYLRAYNMVRAGFPALLPPRMSGDILARPPPIGLPLILQGREKQSCKSLLGYPFSESPKQFACEKCGRTYASTGNLKRHKKYECGVEPQFSCPICKKKFQHRHSVKIHVFSTHRNEAGEPSNDCKDTLFHQSDSMGSIPLKEEFFPFPQEASGNSSQNQDT